MLALKTNAALCLSMYVCVSFNQLAFWKELSSNAVGNRTPMLSRALVSVSLI